MTFQETHWTSHDEPVFNELQAIQSRLGQLLATPESELLGTPEIGADSDLPDSVSSLDEARALIVRVRRGLMFNLLALETHEHWLDDCGDDTQAATDLWRIMFQSYFFNDLDDVATVNSVNAALKEHRALFGADEEDPDE